MSVAPLAYLLFQQILRQDPADEHCLGRDHFVLWCGHTTLTQWLRAQLAQSASGAGVVVGTIAVTDWHKRSESVRDQTIAEYNATRHRHVHGANLSLAAPAYLALGNFLAQPFGEDVALVQAFAAPAEPFAWAVDLPVTSARRKPGAPFRRAGHLDLSDAQASGNG